MVGRGTSGTSGGRGRGQGTGGRGQEAGAGGNDSLCSKGSRSLNYHQLSSAIMHHLLGDLTTGFVPSCLNLIKLSKSGVASFSIDCRKTKTEIIKPSGQSQQSQINQ